MMSAEEDKKEILAPMMESGVHAGFPSPAQDYINSFIDLNKELVRHPAAAASDTSPDTSWASAPERERAAATAQLMPSMAEETMPPE